LFKANSRAETPKAKDSLKTGLGVAYKFFCFFELGLLLTFFLVVYKNVEVISIGSPLSEKV
jgi:hypothetical protein